MLSERPALWILLKGKLTDWEEEFCKSLWKKTDWTDNQLACYMRIRNKYLRVNYEKSDQ